MAETKATDGQCEATFNGLRCEHPKDGHPEYVRGTLEHYSNGVWWTDKSAAKNQIPEGLQCETTFEGMRCQARKKRHLKCGRTLKHHCGGSSWTDLGAARVAAEKLKAVPIQA
jgi:hypothetical protein